MTRWQRRTVMAATVLIGLWPYASYADQTQLSPNYGINESQIGGIGDDSSASTNYTFKPTVDDGGSTLGDTAVGNSASTNFQTGSGFNTSSSPTLTFVVSTGSVALGVLSSTAAVTSSAQFSVEDYTSSGYAVTIVGNAPTNSGHALTAMGTQSANSTGCAPGCASVAGSEQFGLNMRVNSSPNAVGADPVPIPSSAFSLYLPSVLIPTPYQTVNQYRFFSGDTLVSAPSSSGQTNYTIAFMANISPLTPGGTYQGNLTLVTTGTF